MDKDKLQKLIETNKFVLLDFYATWCMPCKMQSEIVEELKEKNIEGLNITKIDVDENEDFVNTYKIVSVPTLILYKYGEIVKRYVGVAKEKDILDWMK